MLLLPHLLASFDQHQIRLARVLLLCVFVEAGANDSLLEGILQAEAMIVGV